ncbi:MAG: LysR family transcriptional regulator [Pseudomonadales bacterium]
MTFGQLEIFVTLAQLQGFTLTAQKLGMTQSAVSHAIKALEREFACELVVRHHTPLELTPVGKQLVMRAREIVGLREIMQQEAQSFAGLQKGSVKIASFGPSSTLHILPLILDAFRARYPGIAIHIEEGPDCDVVNWIEQRRVELGFIVLPNPHFETHFLVQDQFLALIPQGHHLVQQPCVTLQEICAEPLIMTETGNEGGIEKLFSDAGLRPSIVSRTSQVLSTLALVARAEGVAIVAELALPRDRGLQGICVRPLNPQKRRAVGLALNSARQVTPATKAFLQIAQSLEREGAFAHLSQSAVAPE